jgi:hypothetical protein
MDASERIRQLEHGVAHVKTETLTFEQSVCKGGELMKSGKTNDILFSSARMFEKRLEMRLAQLYKVAVESQNTHVDTFWRRPVRKGRRAKDSNL